VERDCGGCRVLLLLWTVLLLLLLLLLLPACLDVCVEWLHALVCGEHHAASSGSRLARSESGSGGH